MTKSLTRVETAAFLSDHDNYVILTHIRPDGDTLGSASALCLGLRSLGKTAHVLVNTGVGGRFRWMLEGLTVEEAGKDDTVISTDVASPGMLPDNAQQYLAGCGCALTTTALPPPFPIWSWWTRTAPPAPRWSMTCWSLWKRPGRRRCWTASMWA